MTELPNKLLVRGSEAREYLGLARDVWEKVVKAGVIQPVYLLWQVCNSRGKVLFEGNAAKTKAWHDEHGGLLKPAGWPYFRRSDVMKLANGQTETASADIRR